MSGQDWQVLAADAAAADAEGTASPAGAAPGGQGTDPHADPGAAPQATPIPTNRDTIAGMLALFRNAATVLLRVESPAVTLSDEKIGQVADACAPVADKYGLRLATMLGGYEVELNAALVAGPVLWQAGKALNDELRARRAKPADTDEAQAGQADKPEGRAAREPERRQAPVANDTPFGPTAPVDGPRAA